MAGIVEHHHFAKVVYSALSDEIKTKINNVSLYEFASLMPDSIKFYNFFSKDKIKQSFDLMERMHKRNNLAFIMELLEECKLNNDLFPYLCGIVCHYYFDLNINPYLFYKSGIYDKKILNSIKYRGLKQKLERAIDSYTIYNYYQGKNPNTFSIKRNLLSLKHLPASINHDIDVLYLKVYNINNGSKFINKIIKNQRFFYSLIYDPIGIKNKIFERIDNGKSEVDFRYLSYYNKSVDTRKFDIFNSKHEKWCNPVTPSLYSVDSFKELFDSSKEMARRCIEAMYRFVFLDQQFNQKYFIHDVNIFTGLGAKENDEMKSFGIVFK